MRMHKQGAHLGFGRELEQLSGKLTRATLVVWPDRAEIWGAIPWVYYGFSPGFYCSAMLHLGPGQGIVSFD
jgi:hypothetical protein